VAALAAVSAFSEGASIWTGWAVLTYNIETYGVCA
jgi:hypothetical protein